MAEAGPLRVSVVEDDADIRAMLREVFTTTEGFRLVNTFRSSELALADAGTEQPDVMVVDEPAGYGRHRVRAADGRAQEGHPVHDVHRV
ncbi:MAG: hypothetical protein IPG92_18405 [Flavobacteriales bacterium]|nr:hypothetical protein [Flavobacteriales bacterium]